MSNDQIQKISQIGIPVTDLNRAVPFYQNLLNLPLLFQTDRMAFFHDTEDNLHALMSEVPY